MATEITSLVDELKYQDCKKINSDFADEILTVKFRYKNIGEEQSNLITKSLKQENKTTNSSNFNFSAAVTSFGMLLRNSEYKGDFTYQKIISLAKDSPYKLDNKRRKEFISLVKKAKALEEYTSK